MAGATRVLVGQSWWVWTGNSCVDFTRCQLGLDQCHPIIYYYLFVFETGFLFVLFGVVLTFKDRLYKGWDLFVCICFFWHIFYCFRQFLQVVFIHGVV